MLFRVLKSITTGHEPGGPPVPAEEFKGADIDWLVRVGAIEPIGGPLRATAARPGDAEEIQEVIDDLHEQLVTARRKAADLEAEVVGLKTQVGSLTEERDKLAQQVEAAFKTVQAAFEERDALKEQVRTLQAGTEPPAAQADPKKGKGK